MFDIGVFVKMQTYFRLLASFDKVMFSLDHIFINYKFKYFFSFDLSLNFNVNINDKSI